MVPDVDADEADRLEQEMPATRDDREHLRIPADAPDADVLEQEAPLTDAGGPIGLDAERTEPVSDEDWTSTSSAG